MNTLGSATPAPGFPRRLRAPFYPKVDMQTSKSLLTRGLPLLVLSSSLWLTACAPTQQAGIEGISPPVSSTNRLMTPAPQEELDAIASSEEITAELATLHEPASWKQGKPEDGDVFVLDGAGPNAVPLVLNEQVNFYLDFFQGKFRGHFTKWLSRSTLYLPTIQRHFAQKGLPPELAALALIESGFNPVAYSSAKAAGLWQFIEPTGKRFGLRVDSYVDERRNPEKASQAAAGYLKALYDEFGHWYLAVAAYNAGEGKMRKAIERYGTRDFWDLAEQPYLAMETKRYVPQLIAAIIILNDPAQYGFGDNDFQFPEFRDMVSLPGATPLGAVALSAGCSVEDLQRLNRELRGKSLPPGRDGYTIAVPRGSGALVAQNLPKVQRRVDTDFATHTVKSGQKIAEICKLYSISTTSLLKANNLHNANLKPGQRLRIPQVSERYVLAGGSTGTTVLAGKTKRLVSREGDESVHVVAQANQRKVQPQANEHVADSRPDTKTPAQAEQQKGHAVLLADQRKTKARPETPQPRATAVAPDKGQLYIVQRGDNLWKIARKFQVSTEDIRRWNRLDSNDLKPGARLLIREV